MDYDEARQKLERFLQSHYGPDLTDPDMGQMVAPPERYQEHPNAFTFAFNTVKYFETGDIFDGIMAGVVVVPKDGFPVHWAPTHLPPEEYLAKVADGTEHWSFGGATEDELQIEYYALLGPDRSRSNATGVMRRLIMGEKTVSEVFTDDLAWHAVDSETHPVAGNDVDRVEITADEASELVGKVVRQVTGG